MSENADNNQLHPKARQIINSYMIGTLITSWGVIGAITWYVANKETSELATRVAKAEAQAELDKLETTKVIIDEISKLSLQQQQIAVGAANDATSKLREITALYSSVTNGVAKVQTIVDSAPDVEKALQSVNPENLANELLKGKQFQEQIAVRIPPYPIGTIVAYWGTSDPKGWKLCDGREVDVSDPKMTKLREHLGSNTLPDLRGMFLRGAENRSVADGANDTGGPRKLGSTQAYSTSFRLNNKEGENWYGKMFARTFVTPFKVETNPDKPTTHNLIYVGTAEPEQNFETRPVNVAVNFIIKY